MKSKLGRCATAAAVLATAPALAQQVGGRDLDGATQAEILDGMRSISGEIEALRARGASPRRAQLLRSEYASLSARLGGDDPALLLGGAAAASSTFAFAPRVAAPACSGASPTTASYSGSTGAIPDLSVPLTLTAVVSTAHTYLWDVDLATTIAHTFNADLDISLTSPAGTTVTITTDNGGAADNVFNGTTWNDNANDPVTDHIYANNVTATPLSPEGRLQAFRGENPNGAWTLTLFDDAATNTGTLSAWSLAISTLASAPATATTTVSRTPGLAIPPGAPGTTSGTTTDTVVVGPGLAPYVFEVALYTEIVHTSNADLDVSLTSPAGTVVRVTTDNGSSHDDAFNGTTWDVDATTTVTDAVYANLVTQTLLSPEGAFDNFLGQDPNGVWTLTVTDDASNETGALVRWDLTITTASPAPAPAAPVSYTGGGTPVAINDPAGSPPLVATAVVGGAGPYLWDVDLTTAITHTACGDLDVTLTSPAGTTVKVTTDNGGAEDDVFDGTLWDMQANGPPGDHAYANLVTATPLSPEGSFDAFRGENPNGTWMLTVDDDFTGQTGVLNAWSIDLTTLPSAPSSATASYSRSPALPILDLTTATDTLAVSGLGTQILEVVLYTEITHTWTEDVDVFLVSPAGTSVAVSTDNGGSNDDVFNGTTWDPDVTDTVTDHVYSNLVVATPLSPEGSFGNFLGQDPNGTWSIVVADDVSPDEGVLVRWDLTISTCGPSCPVADVCDPLSPDVTDGCTPDASWVGAADVTQCNTPGASDFVVTFGAMSEAKSCSVVLGKGAPAAIPWSTQSTRCFPTPYSRTGQGDTGDANGPAPCGGSISIDVENYLQGGNPLLTPAAAGDDYVVQTWYRDPASSKTTQMTDALHFTVCP
jgi:subtilisin-like proprotein convertase family protein